MRHFCHAYGCAKAVPPRLFMCKRHWYMLPKEMRDAVWRHYQPGQEDRLVTPSAEYLRAADEAIAWLRQKEQK